MSDQVPGADDLGFDLLPADDVGADPQTQLAAAADAAVSDAAFAAEPEDPPEPFGFTHIFDFTTGRFVRRGTSPARVVDHDALAQWCLAALYARRRAHAVYSDEFGVDWPAALGAVAADAREAADDIRSEIVDALMVHDRISAVSLDVTYDPLAGVIYIANLQVTTDEETDVNIDDMAIPAEAVTG